MHSALKKPPPPHVPVWLCPRPPHIPSKGRSPPLFAVHSISRTSCAFGARTPSNAAHRTPRLICLILPSTEHPFPSHSHVSPPRHAHPPPHPQLPHVQGGKVQTGQHAVRGGELRQDPEEDQHRHAHQGGARLPGTAAGAGTATCLYLPGLHDLPVRAHGVGSLRMSMRRAFIPATSRPTPQGKLRHN